jgi:uncharacterized repeat protein (TIGR01451 family)
MRRVDQTQCVRFRVRVNDSGLPIGTVIANSAHADFTAATTGAVDAGVETAPALTVVRVPDLAVVKSHDPAFVPGGESTFEIVVRNDGDGAARGPVTARDTLAPDFTLAGPAGGAGWTCSTGGAPVTITCKRADTLAAGAAYPAITLPVRVSGTATPGSLSNTAVVDAAADGNADNNSATDAGAVSEPLVDLVVTKTAPNRPIDGMPMRYAITVTNRGVSPAPDVMLSDTLPATFALDAQPPFPEFAGDTDFTNTAVANSGGHETDPTDNTAAVTRRSVAVVDVYAIAQINSPVLAGGPITITYRIGNRGPQAADVHGTGALQDLTTGVFGLPGQQAELTHGPGECVLDSPGNNFCGFPAIAPGEERIVTQTATLPPGIAGHTLRVRIDGLPSQYEPATNAGDDADEETVVVHGVNVAAEKQRLGGTGAVPPGGEATFRLTARNAGGLEPDTLNLPATGVTVRDELPAGLTLVDAPAACTRAGQAVTCDAGTLALGEQRSFDLVVRAGPGFAGLTLANAATVSAAEPDWHPEDDRATADLPIAPALALPMPANDLSVRVSPPTRAVREGDTTTWHITAANAGPATATGVTLTATPHGATGAIAHLARTGCDAGAPLTCELGTLAAGTQRTITVRMRRVSPGRLALAASIHGVADFPAAGTRPAPAT